MFNKILQALGLRHKPAVAPLPMSGPAGAASVAAPTGAKPIHVTDAEFQATVLESDKLAVVDFWADWCGPCHRMAPHIDYLAEDFAGRVVVAKLDVDANPQTPGQFKIMGIPTVIFFKNGKEVDRMVGVSSLDKLSKKVEALG